MRQGPSCVVASRRPAPSGRSVASRRAARDRGSQQRAVAIDRQFATPLRQPLSCWHPHPPAQSDGCGGRCLLLPPRCFGADVSASGWSANRPCRILRRNKAFPRRQGQLTASSVTFSHSSPCSTKYRPGIRLCPLGGKDRPISAAITCSAPFCAATSSRLATSAIPTHWSGSSKKWVL